MAKNGGQKGVFYPIDRNVRLVKPFYFLLNGGGLVAFSVSSPVDRWLRVSSSGDGTSFLQERLSNFCFEAGQELTDVLRRLVQGGDAKRARRVDEITFRGHGPLT